MSGKLDNLEPKLVWRNFELLTKVPRPSKKEDKAIEFVLNWAKENRFEAKKDKAGNVVVQVPGKGKNASHPPVVLQGHLDMVCEKNKGVEFDFETQPLNLRVDGDWVTADGTTLGADNGIGVAMAMSIAQDAQAHHPPLELLFTVDEETGLTGATHLEPGFITGSRMINIDSEEEGTIFIGCAGGGDTEVVLPVKLDIPPHTLRYFTVKVGGLAGGHSGLNIHENRANALKLLGLSLAPLVRKGAVLVASVNGGDKHNAIPREAEAIIASDDLDVDQLRAHLDKMEQNFSQEYGSTDSGLTITVETGGEGPVMSPDYAAKVIDLIVSLPHGVDTMSKEIPGLVETSTNLAKVVTQPRSVKFLNSSRSSVAAALERMRLQIEAVSRLAGAACLQHPGYPGWRPNPDSALLAVCKEVYKGLYGSDPRVTAIHAGLECGIIGEKYPGIDMVSMGPTMSGVHSPDERVSIASVARFYEYLKKLLAAL